MSWLDRLKTGLTRSTAKLGDSLTGLATGTLPLDEARLDEIEEALIAADLGPAVAGRIRERLADEHYLDTYGLRLVAGRTFVAGDTIREYVINETLLHRLGFRDPKQVLGQKMQYHLFGHVG